MFRGWAGSCSCPDQQATRIWNQDSGVPKAAQGWPDAQRYGSSARQDEEAAELDQRASDPTFVSVCWVSGLVLKEPQALICFWGSGHDMHLGHALNVEPLEVPGRIDVVQPFLAASYHLLGIPVKHTGHMLYRSPPDPTIAKITLSIMQPCHHCILGGTALHLP